MRSKYFFILLIQIPLVIILSFMGCQNNTYDTKNDVDNLKFKDIAAGPSHSLLLDENGQAYHLGSGAYDVYNDKDREDWKMPKRIKDLDNVISVDAGYMHLLMLDENGKVFSSGFGGYGNLGWGEDKEPIKPAHIEWDKEYDKWISETWSAEDLITPQKVINISGAKDISAGAKHSLVLLENGEVYSFGYNYWGQLGHGDGKHRYYPEKIEGITNAKATSAGAYYSLVLLETGEVYSFGRNEWGQLGVVDYEKNYFEPEKIKGLTNVKKIAAGIEHSLVMLENGEVYSFGNPRYGQLGRKMEFNDVEVLSTNEIIELPLEERLLYHEKVGTHFMPARVEGIEDAKDISVGLDHSLVLNSNGNVKSFGNNFHGELGHGDRKTREKPENIESLSDVKEVSASMWQSLVLLSNGEVYSFGNNTSGQIGHDKQERILTPQKVEICNSFERNR